MLGNMKIMILVIWAQIFTLTSSYAAVVRYKYDQYGQLSSARYSNGIWQKYDYDSIGNRLNHSTLLNALGGDVDGDSSLGLSDAILTLQICSGKVNLSNVNIHADIDESTTIGIAEAVYVLEQLGNQ